MHGDRRCAKRRVYINPSGERPECFLYLFGNKAVLLHKEVTNYVKRRMSGDVSRNVSEPYRAVITDLKLPEITEINLPLNLNIK